ATPFSGRRLSMTTRSWLRNLLTTVLARLTRRDPSGARPQVGWDGRPLVATEGTRSPDAAASAAGYSTMPIPGPPARSERTRSVEAPGGAVAGQAATPDGPRVPPNAASQPTSE